MKYRQIILINIIICTFLTVTNGCTIQNKGSKYIFPDEENINYFIVNLRNIDDKDFKNIRNTFEFNNSRLIVLNKSAYDISPKDSFFVRNNDGILKAFDPNEAKENKFKLCYFQNIKNVGFSIPYYSTEFGVIPLGKYQNLDIEYDYFYFRVGKKCNNNFIDYHEDLRRLLVQFFSQDISR